LSLIKHVTLQKIVAHDFRYDLRILCSVYVSLLLPVVVVTDWEFACQKMFVLKHY